MPIEYFSLSNHWTPVVSEGYNAKAFLKGSDANPRDRQVRHGQARKAPE